MSWLGLIKQLFEPHSTLRVFIGGYLFCFVVGWLLLQLPLSQQRPIEHLDVLFTAASAISTTGLATIDIGTALSLFGQLVVLILIQCGGIGYLILSAYVVLNLEHRNLTFRRKESLLPSLLARGMKTKDLIGQALLFTAVAEISGSLILFFFFRSAGVENPLWSALFHTVSAFCTAGFSLFATNLEAYKEDFGVNIILSLLSLLGAFGFFLWIDCIKMNFSIKVVARALGSCAAAMSVIGGILFLATTLDSLLPSLFQALSSISTSGFNTIDMRALPNAASVVLILLMLIGVSLTGNGLHLRGSTFASFFKLGTATNWERRRQSQRLQLALFSFAIYLALFLLFGLALLAIEGGPKLPLLFECASALCTVGLSLGITSSLSAVGKSLLLFLMLSGRIAVLIFGFALSSRAPVLTAK